MQGLALKHGFKQITSKLHNQVSGHTDEKKSPGRSHIRIEHHSNLTQTQTNRSKKKNQIKTFIFIDCDWTIRSRKELFMFFVEHLMCLHAKRLGI